MEVLILERNRLEGDADLTSLSKAPRLRELNLSFNYFKRIPEAAAMGTGFRMLEWLSLANNYIASERDILPLVRFPRLLQVILYVSSSLPNTRASQTLPTYPPACAFLQLWQPHHREPAGPCSHSRGRANSRPQRSAQCRGNRRQDCQPGHRHTRHS